MIQACAFKIDCCLVFAQDEITLSLRDLIEGDRGTLGQGRHGSSDDAAEQRGRRFAQAGARSARCGRKTASNAKWLKVLHAQEIKYPGVGSAGAGFGCSTLHPLSSG